MPTPARSVDADILEELRRLRRLSQPLNRFYQRQWTNAAPATVPGSTGKDLTVKQPFEISIPKERPRGPGWPFSWYAKNTGSQDTMSIWYGTIKSMSELRARQQRPTLKYGTLLPGQDTSQRSDPEQIFIQFDTNAGGDIGVEYSAGWLEE